MAEAHASDLFNLKSAVELGEDAQKPLTGTDWH